MQVIQLYIEGQRVDMFKDESVSITQTIQNVKDISKVFTEFSKTFSLPSSKTNNKIFQHYYNYDIINGFDARKKKTARIELNNKTFKKGKIKLEGVDLKEGKPNSYRVTFYGNTVDLKDLLGEDNLASLDWLDNFNHDYNATQVRTALTTGIDKTVDSVTYTDALVAPLITHTTRLYYDSALSNPVYPDALGGNLYSTGSSFQGVYFEELKYAIPIYIIVKAIEQSYDITFSNNFFNDTNVSYKNLYMWLHRKKGNAFDEGEAVSSLITGFPSDFLSMSRIYSNPNKLFVYNLTGSQLINYTLTVSTSGAQSYSIIIKKDGLVYDQTTIENAGSGTMTGTLGNSSTGYQVFIYASTAFTVTSVSMAVSDTTLSESATFSTSASQSITTTRSYIITEQIPEMKVIDFLTGLFKMFNLTAYYDDNQIKIETLDSYYQNSTTTWDVTKYVDSNSSSVDVALPFKRVDFKFEGLGTKLALQHQQAFNSGWGTTEYNGDDNYDSSEKIYSVVAPFEHLKFEHLINGSTTSVTTAQVGWFVDDNNDPYFGKPLLFYPVNTSGTTIRFLNAIPSSYTDISSYFVPSNSVELTSATDNSNINFNLEINEYSFDSSFEGTLFKDYYSTYIQNIYNNKLRLTKVKAYLPISFLLNYSLADKIQIVEKIYTINSIQSNLETGESQLELLNVVPSSEPPVVSLPTVLTTSATSVTETSATFNGQVTDIGSPAYTQRGFYWKVGTGTPTASDNVQIVSGTDTNVYSFNNTSLSANNTYSFVAFATNSQGTATGNTFTVNTSAAPSVPTVVTSGSTSITQTSATIIGNVTFEGNPNYTVKGFYWKQGTGTPTASNNVVNVAGTSTGSYSTNLSSLTLNNTYSFVAFCTNTEGTVTGSTLTFATASGLFLPSVSTNAITSVGTSTATLNGTITNVGNPNYTEKGFVYIAGSGTPTTSNTKTIVSGTSSGAYSKGISSLNSSQLYSVRAYAINTQGTAYGAVQTFTTSTAATCSGGTLFFNNSVITGINATLATGSISYSTSQCGATIPTVSLLFTNNVGEWVSTSQITSLQLYEGSTNVTSQYTLGKTLNGDVMNITIGGNFPSSSNDGNHSYEIRITAYNIEAYTTTITLPASNAVNHASVNVTKNSSASYPASRDDTSFNNGILYPSGSSGDAYEYTITYTADSNFTFTGLGNITTPLVSPTGTGVSVNTGTYTSSTLTVIVSGTIQASDKAATISYSGSAVASPATSITFRYRIQPQTTWNTFSVGFNVPENVVVDLEATPNGSYSTALSNTSLTTAITPTTNTNGDVEVHQITIANGLVGGGNKTSQVQFFPQGSSTLLTAVRINFIDN